MNRKNSGFFSNLTNRLFNKNIVGSFYISLVLAFSGGIIFVYLSMHEDAIADTKHSSPVASIERTLSIIKPDGVENNYIGEVYKRYSDAKLKVVAAKMITLSRDDAQKHYSEHRGKPFYNDLIDYICSGPIMVQVLEGPDAINLHRSVMGSYKNPQEGTIRGDLAESAMRNVVHGSDSPDVAAKEIAFFFSEREIYHY